MADGRTKVIPQLGRAIRKAFGQGAYADGVQHHGFNVSLPTTEAALLRDELGRARCVLEYGSGGSTFAALEQGAQFVLSVESDAAWARKMQRRLEANYDASRFCLHHADIGPTKSWGVPRSAAGYARYHRYATAPYGLPQFRQPDLILRDGRFRTACFLTAMLRLCAPARLLFDDYGHRPHYHWVEQFFKPVAMAGRMAVFEIEPQAFPVAQLEAVLAAFTDYR